MERVKKAEDEKTHKKVKTTGKRSEKQSKYDKLSSTSKITKGKKPQPKKHKVSVSSDSESSQSLCMDTDSEEEYSLDQLISSSSDESLPEEIDPTRVEPRLEMYYAVYYDLDWYVGRVIDFPDEGLCKVKFLKKELSGFNWPAHDDIQTVPSRFVLWTYQTGGKWAIPDFERTAPKNLFCLQQSQKGILKLNQKDKK